MPFLSLNANGHDALTGEAGSDRRCSDSDSLRGNAGEAVLFGRESDDLLAPAVAWPSRAVAKNG